MAVDEPFSPPSSDRTGRILFVDAFDSFSHNIVSLLETLLKVDVYIIQIDHDFRPDGASLSKLLKQFDAVVVGPGPGHPGNPPDVGFINELWRSSDGELIPILGICLGFQSLACAFGARMQRLEEPKHGMICNVQHRNKSIFAGVEEVRAIRYHSLHVDIGQFGSASQSDGDRPELWEPSPTCPALEPLGWALDDTENGPVLMAVKHKSKPFWGLQYHPESVCTEEKSTKVLENWWAEAKRWHKERSCRTGPESNLLREPTSPQLRRLGDPQPPSRTARASPEKTAVATEVVKISDSVTAVQLCDILTETKDATIILDSAVMREGTGRYSMIGIVADGRTPLIQYWESSRTTRISISGHSEVDTYHSEPIWDFLAEFLQDRHAVGGADGSPFWGGLMGCVSYEMGLSSIAVPIHTVSASHPDITFAFVARSLVIDHLEGKIFVQTLFPQDHDWLYGTANLIRDSLKTQNSRMAQRARSAQSDETVEKCLRSANIITPDEDKYKQRVRQCQEHIRAGDSYELCLTNQTRIRIAKNSNDDVDWILYKRLRSRNAATFGAYLSLGGLTVISSSPERFLRSDRSGKVQMRPIKGTVKKGPCVTRAVAEKILTHPKEQAENLMIVDLIRHDLHGVMGAGKVEVAKLFSIEEYESVFQLVSVIEGQLPLDGGRSRDRNYQTSASTAKPGSSANKTIDLLAATLPPGSMTGAPKKRSCELLCELEDHQPRGIYSGVLGYMCVSGSADFSVVIRSAFKWTPTLHDKNALSSGSTGQIRSNGVERHAYDEWRIGAGGAVTALSTAEGEYEEMKTKLNSTLGAFIVEGTTVKN
ncbi:MAG: para-aminobenzoate synthase, (PABA) [Caeruleum heppii]|nr:MAG: para-aminobenzoate synthase, (PABA) [Caeruleum heppii]